MLVNFSDKRYQISWFAEWEVKALNENCLVKTKTLHAQALQIAIAGEIADGEAKALHSQANDNVRSMDKASVVNRAKGKETLPRSCRKPLPKFEKKGQKVQCYGCGELHRQEEGTKDVFLWENRSHISDMSS